MRIRLPRSPDSLKAATPADNGTARVLIRQRRRLSPGYGLGYADSADAGNPAGLPTTTIEVKYTLYGDTNLDGAVNSVDFGNLAANFGKSGKSWDQGDFDYTGTVNSIDFGLLAANFGRSASGATVALPQSDWQSLDAFAAANGLLAEVPEPTGSAAIAVGCVGLLYPRRRKPIRAID